MSKPECICGSINARHCQVHQESNDSELTLEQWKNKFKNANMDKSESIFRERKAQAEITELKEKLEIAASLLREELDTDSINAVRDFIDRKQEFLKSLEKIK